MMRRVADIDAYLRAQDACCFVSDSFAYWQMGPALKGCSIWGNMDRASYEQRARLLDRDMAPGRPRMRLLIDCRYCTETNPVSYDRAHDFWVSRRERIAATIEQLAVVVPKGIVGAVILGISTLLDPGVRLRIFRELEPALEWLGCDDPGALAAELITQCPVEVENALLESLGRVITDQMISIDLPQAARRMGMSARTLQRRLKTVGTTYQAELSRAKLCMATRLMLSSDLSMTAIAIELGFASLQHFSARFKSAYGESPRHWIQTRMAESAAASGVAPERPGRLSP